MKKLFNFVMVASLVWTPVVALASHPGPGGQGPNTRACDGPGAEGIAVAAAHGGNVHCEDGGPAPE